MKKKLRAIICAVLIIVAGAPVITDYFGSGTALQYSYNMAYLLVILPVLIALSGIVEWGTRPENR